MTEQEKMITTAELAEMLRVSVRSIENWRAHYPKRLPPATRVGVRTIRYRLADVEAWLKARQKATYNEDCGVDSTYNEDCDVDD